MAKEKNDRYESFQILKHELLTFTANPNVNLQPTPSRFWKNFSKLSPRALVALMVAVLTIAGRGLSWAHFSAQQAAEKEVWNERLTKQLKAIDPDKAGSPGQIQEKDVQDAVNLSTLLKDDTALVTSRLALARL
jgi:hypothetical protein